jgi:hypothetical protein
MWFIFWGVWCQWYSPPKFGIVTDLRGMFWKKKTPRGQAIIFKPHFTCLRKEQVQAKWPNIVPIASLPGPTGIAAKHGSSL